MKLKCLILAFLNAGIIFLILILILIDWLIDIDMELMNANMMLKKMMWFLHLPCSPTVQSAADWKDVRNWNGSVSLEIYQEPNRKHRKPIYSTQEPYNRNQPKQGPISVHLSLYLSVCVPCQECNKWPEAFSGLQTFFFITLSV